MTQTVPLTPEEIERVRLEKIKSRRYYTVSLSDRLIPEGEPFHCHKCKSRVTTVYNEPAAMVEVKINPNDAGTQKLTENMCRTCNIIFLFV